MILDTHALSAFVDGNPAVGEVLRDQPRACIPVIVLGKFRHDIAQSRHRAAYEGWLASEMPNFDVLPVTERTTVFYAELRAARRHRGTPIPANGACRGARLAAQVAGVEPRRALRCGSEGQQTGLVRYAH